MKNAADGASPGQSERTIRVMIVDDHPVYRDGLALLLSSIDGFEVVGTASDGGEAIAMANGSRPDVVVMDVEMATMNGIEATRHLTRHHPEVGVLVLTMSEADETVLLAMQAGARGYLLKGSTPEEISRAVSSVARGDAVLGPAIAARASTIFARLSQGEDPYPFPELTVREREILDLLTAGLANAGIAERLHLAPKTVRNNVTQIFVKLGVSSRVEAVLLARDAGLGSSGR